MSLPATDQVERAAVDRSDQDPTDTVMTLIVPAHRPTPALARSVEALQRATLAYRTEVVVVTDVEWPGAPEGVRVVVSGSVSRGDKLDRGAEGASGEILAFIEEEASLPEGWQERAITRLADPTIGAVGGPHLLPATVTTSQEAAWMLLHSFAGSGPLRYRFQRRRPRLVRELPTSNLVVRTEAFRAVGGFQSPTALGDDARLCHKLRSLLGRHVVYDPELVVETVPPAFPQPFLSLIAEWGRQRGDLLRRLPEATQPLPYILPALLMLAAVVALILSPSQPAARFVVLLLGAGYLAGGLWLLIRSRGMRVGLRAAAGLPAMHLAYAIGLISGYVGRSQGEISPGRPGGPPLRILILNWRDVTHPWAGGAESYMHELARRWVRAGCDVGWVSERYRIGQRAEVIDGIRFFRVGGHFTLYPLAALLYLLRLRTRYDVIIDCENGIPFFSPLYCRKPVILLVHHLHQEVFHRELPASLRWLALWLEGTLMPLVYRSKDIVTVSASSRTQLEARGYPADRLTVVTNGVDVPGDTTTKARSPAPLILYLGRLKRYKSVDVLLRALPTVLRAHPNAQLAIVGQGPDRARLERIVWSLDLAASVRFHGYLDRADKERLLSKAWVAVCPSAFEGWGVVCLEANAWGVPVVASRVPGLCDAVLDEQTGLLVPYGDSERFAAELVSLLSDAERRRMLGAAGRGWAAAHDWDSSASLFLQKIRGVMSLRPVVMSAPG